MGRSQTGFLNRFRSEFCRRFGPVKWGGGQVLANCGRLSPNRNLRREGKLCTTERFELGDARCDLAGHAIIVEFDSDKIVVSNLLKYWPYLRGELCDVLSRRIVPDLPILLCHFSNWYSYGSYRDLWQWLLERIQQDCGCRVRLAARQFDFHESDPTVTEQSVCQALDWLGEMTAG